MTASEIGGRESETREMQYDAMEYMAPERLFFEPQGPTSDVYSLAVTLFEMLAGKPIGKALRLPNNTNFEWKSIVNIFYDPCHWDWRSKKNWLIY